jgi:dihydroorotate dehydrogenase
VNTVELLGGGWTWDVLTYGEHRTQRSRPSDALCTNTTIDRSAVEGHRRAAEAGGLSGAPLMAPSTHVLREMATRLAGTVPIIGIGGILSGDDAVAKFEAGASLVQFYTGMVYRGPELIGECVEALRKAGV